MENEQLYDFVAQRTARCKILVVGDVMLDKYYYGEVTRISPEAPVPITHVLETKETLGGAANVAHNLALLGAKVRLITALGADDGAKRIEASCADLGIDLSDSLYVPDGATSTYLFLADSNGDMALAMNDMAIYGQLGPSLVRRARPKLTTLTAAALVVLDTTPSAESIRYLGEHCTAPLFADPVSAAKAGKLEPILGRLHTLKPNRMEAELLSGVTVTDGASLYRAADTTG